MAEDQTTDKYPVQFRLGQYLLAKVDEAVEQSGKSRNQWMIDAIHRYIERGESARYPITAEQILAHKVTLMVRVDSITLELVNEQCDDREIPRTVWLLDACISMLAASNGVRKRRRSR